MGLTLSHPHISKRSAIISLYYLFYYIDCFTNLCMLKFIVIRCRVLTGNINLISNIAPIDHTGFFFFINFSDLKDLLPLVDVTT